MKAFAIVGASALGKAPFVEKLVEAFRLDDHTVSIVKHAPDGFDIDTPGKASHVRREAGAGEVMLVGDRRLVLLKEYQGAPEPGLAALLARLEPVDLVIIEGFRSAPYPTLEVHRPSHGRAPRWAHNRHVVAVASDEPQQAPVPVFALDDVAALAGFMAGQAGIVVPRRALASRPPRIAR